MEGEEVETNQKWEESEQGGEEGGVEEMEWQPQVVHLECLVEPQHCQMVVGQILPHDLGLTQMAPHCSFVLAFHL